jgi:ribosomal protein S18 acetylase RimI-like enzyme
MTGAAQQMIATEPAPTILQVETLTVERLSPDELEEIRPLLIDLHMEEQPHYDDHPQLSRPEVDAFLGRIEPGFIGENVVFVARTAPRDGRPGGDIAGFCWVVLFDPGTGLEGEVAEVYVGSEHRGRGLGEALVRRAVQLFKERAVTLGYVWTRAENEAATRLYQRAGFEPTRQLVLTWYP